MVMDQYIQADDRWSLQDSLSCVVMSAMGKVRRSAVRS
jgi:hypothetical protein